MYGNVMEWVEDDWHENYKGAPTDGMAWVNKPRDAGRVFRSGVWSRNEQLCWTSFRFEYPSGYGRDDVGFRLARSVARGP